MKKTLCCLKKHKKNNQPTNNKSSNISTQKFHWGNGFGTNKKTCRGHIFSVSELDLSSNDWRRLNGVVNIGLLVVVQLVYWIFVWPAGDGRTECSRCPVHTLTKSGEGSCDTVLVGVDAPGSKTVAAARASRPLQSNYLKEKRPSVPCILSLLGKRQHIQKD